MEILLKLFYVALFIAIIFFCPLQEYLYKKKSEWDLKKNSREPKTDKTPVLADPEKNGVHAVYRAYNISPCFLYLENTDYYFDHFMNRTDGPTRRLWER